MDKIKAIQYLRKIEWSHEDHSCPECEAHPPWYGTGNVGHRLDCELANALKDLGSSIKVNFEIPDNLRNRRMRPNPHKSGLIYWRGGTIEFGTGENTNIIHKEPWYVLEIYLYKGQEPWIYWLDYQGPPQVFLTKRVANEKAKGLRKQYSCKVKIVEIGIKKL